MRTKRADSFKSNKPLPGGNTIVCVVNPLQNKAENQGQTRR